MSQITIAIDDALLQQKLKEVEEALGDAHLTLLMDTIGEQLVEEIRRRIKTNRQWGGGQFAPNSAVTLARKRGTQPLLDSRVFVSNRLYHHPSARSVVIGASALQAAVLQFGAKKGQFGRTRRGAPIPWGDIPARPYMPITDSGELHPEAHALVRTIIDEYVDSVTHS